MANALDKMQRSPRALPRRARGRAAECRAALAHASRLGPEGGPAAQAGKRPAVCGCRPTRRGNAATVLGEVAGGRKRKSRLEKTVGFETIGSKTTPLRDMRRRSFGIQYFHVELFHARGRPCLFRARHQLNHRQSHLSLLTLSGRLQPGVLGGRNEPEHGRPPEQKCEARVAQRRMEAGWSRRVWLIDRDMCSAVDSRRDPSSMPQCPMMELASRFEPRTGGSSRARQARGHARVARRRGSRHGRRDQSTTIYGDPMNRASACDGFRACSAEMLGLLERHAQFEALELREDSPQPFPETGAHDDRHVGRRHQHEPR